jgi:hypothetical protein
MLKLEQIKRTDSRILNNMTNHYSNPKGFVGRNICYAILYNGIYYGAIVGGSATLHLPGRNQYFNIDKSKLNQIINNIFFHCEKVDNKYPIRNFTTKVIQKWRVQISKDWTTKYDDLVLGFETLVELPRTGECYKRDGWSEIGQTVGYTCKRTAGKGTDNWGGKRVWDTKNLRPKRVFVRNND